MSIIVLHFLSQCISRLVWMQYMEIKWSDHNSMKGAAHIWPGRRLLINTAELKVLFHPTPPLMSALWCFSSQVTLSSHTQTFPEVALQNAQEVRQEVPLQIQVSPPVSQKVKEE